MVKYIPLAPVWFWYCLRARSLWFFTPSNPTITFGGFEGEPKEEIYKQLPPGSFPYSIYINPSMPFAEVEKLIRLHELGYPFAVKPDVGMMGFMFRKIYSIDKLREYHQKMPARYIIQQLVTYPLEVSVFYYRFPNQKKGTITGFLKKEFLEVTGDGRSSLLQLMLYYDRVRFRLEEMKMKHRENLDKIIPEGEPYCLSYALNLSRGGRLISLAHEIDERLVNMFDELCNYTRFFYYGRYDIKCASIADLKAGRNFTILEYNGSGAEPHHAYGNGNTLLQAYKIFLHHWKVLYQISKYNKDSGIDYWKFREGRQFLKNAKKHFKILKQLDIDTEL
ncbi:MAG: hypothetical protein JWP81_5207 [Ferruginibacter sp.]|nr:hypothetical protein [Ferruginibacter sp.]